MAEPMAWGIGVCVQLMSDEPRRLGLGLKQRVIVSDYDRTLTDESLTLCRPVIEALMRLKEEYGTNVIVASGRRLSFLLSALSNVHLADAFVAENGAVVHFPHSAATVTLGEDPSKIKTALRTLSVPIEEGHVITSTKRVYEEEVSRIVQEKRLNVEIQYNRDDLMILPSGISKAVGVKEAIRRLELSNPELICIGDAENDLSLFEIASIRVATANAIPEVKNKADVVCIGVGSLGLVRFLDDLHARYSDKARNSHRER